MAIHFLLGFLSILFLCRSALGAGVEYNYHAADATYGPSGWANTYPQYCNGSRQSPIDIQTSKTNYDSTLGGLTLTGFNTIPAGAKLRASNNGKSYALFFTPNKFSVSGEGLPAGTFYTHNIHFHWGSDNTKGSEHTVNGNKYPAEAHFVNVNAKYPNISEALKNSDGIAVLGILLQVGDENPALTALLKYAANLTKPSTPDIENITMTHPLASLLPPNITDFYRYSGSLTTPSCQEVVTWTVFKNPANISANQLSMLRNLKESDNTTSLVDTFRPVQPINSRVIKTSFKISVDDPNNGAYHVTNTMTTVSVVIAMAIFIYGVL